MGCRKGGTKRYYSKEEKLRIVEEVGLGRSSRQVAESSGIADSIVRKWVRQYRDGGEEALVSKRKTGNPLAGYANRKVPSEVEQLRHELALAHMEIARLKKVKEQEWRDGQAKK
jgi:transposase-like protein